jgi:hypothetical protein
MFKFLTLTLLLVGSPTYATVPVNAEIVFFSNEQLFKDEGQKFLSNRAFVRREPFALSKISKSSVILKYLEHDNLLKLKRSGSENGYRVYKGKQKHKGQFGDLGTSRYSFYLSEDLSRSIINKSFTDSNGKVNHSVINYQKGQLVECGIRGNILACGGGFIVGNKDWSPLEYDNLLAAAQIKNIVADESGAAQVMVIKTHYTRSVSADLLSDAYAGSTSGNCHLQYCIGQKYRKSLSGSEYIEGDIVGISTHGNLILKNVKWRRSNGIIIGALDKVYAYRVMEPS